LAFIAGHEIHKKKPLPNADEYIPQRTLRTGLVGGQA